MSSFISIRVFTLVPNSTVDTPRYKFLSCIQFSVEVARVKTLADFESLIVQNATAGFLSSQFFRICEAQNIEQNIFIDTTDELLELLQRNYLELGLVRYTKAQAVQLKKKVSPEETVILDLILTQRRVYSKSR